MASSAKATTLLFFLTSLISHAYNGDALLCDHSDIHVTQTKTGRLVGGVPEMEVTISTECACKQIEVCVRCVDLPWEEPVDASLLECINWDDHVCQVAKGRPIVKGSPVTFRYASRTPQDFAVLGAGWQC